MPAIDIDRDAAHQAAQRELAKPIYPKDSPVQRFGNFVDQLLHRLAQYASSLPGGWFTITVLLILVGVAVVVATRIARRTIRTHRCGDYQLFGSDGLRAAQHRANAQRCAAQGDWSAAIRHRLRAVARQLEEAGILGPVAGRTANELAHDASARLPGLAPELSAAATAFNDVSYGGRTGTPDAYRMITDLDDHLRSCHPARTPAVNQSTMHDSWAPVR